VHIKFARAIKEVETFPFKLSCSNNNTDNNNNNKNNNNITVAVMMIIIIIIIIIIMVIVIRGNMKMIGKVFLSRYIYYIFKKIVLARR
jgi:Ca2+/Na+ antiporter